jgi:MtN3 and saliva related transmembrane protein
MDKQFAIENKIVIDTIGYVAGLLTTICLIPQLMKIIITKSTNDISLSTFIVLLLDQILLAIYGILVFDLRIVIANIISLLITVFIIFFTLIYSDYY